MPAAVAVPLIVGGASAGASLVGAKMASNASRRAGDVQERAAREAANYQRQVTGQTLNYLQNAQQGAQQPPSASYSALSRAMGLGGPRVTSMDNRPGGPSVNMPASPFTFNQPQGATGGGMVLLEAPTGERRAFPWAEAQRHIARGARVVQ